MAYFDDVMEFMATSDGVNNICYLDLMTGEIVTECRCCAAVSHVGNPGKSVGFSFVHKLSCPCFPDEREAVEDNLMAGASSVGKGCNYRGSAKLAPADQCVFDLVIKIGGILEAEVDGAAVMPALALLAARNCGVRAEKSGCSVDSEAQEFEMDFQRKLRFKSPEEVIEPE